MTPLLTVPDLTTMLTDSVTTWGRMGAPAICERFTLRNGRAFKGRKLPKSYARGTPKNCFQNAADLAGGDPFRLRYAEGYAMRNDLAFPFQHAWVIDRSNRVIDVTLDRPEACQYFGVPMTARECWAEMERTGVYGLFVHAYINTDWMFRLDPGLRAEVEAVIGQKVA